MWVHHKTGKRKLWFAHGNRPQLINTRQIGRILHLQKTIPLHSTWLTHNEHFSLEVFYCVSVLTTYKIFLESGS
jgi:hypothetical protein